MIDTLKIYTSTKCGDFKIVRHTNKKMFLVEFIDTGYQASAYLYQIKTGSIKDRLKPSVLGFGFIGEGKYRSTIKGINTKAYRTWSHMLARCYCPKYLNNNPSYKDCYVDSDWLNFQIFAKWFDDNYINGFDLDKDVKVKGNKVYSASTCLFVSPAANTIKANAKSYNFISPQGEVVEIYNMNEFCRNSNLCQSSMIAVNNGKNKHHKGWVKSK